MAAMLRLEANLSHLSLYHNLPAEQTCGIPADRHSQGKKQKKKKMGKKVPLRFLESAALDGLFDLGKGLGCGTYGAVVAATPKTLDFCASTDVERGMTALFSGVRVLA